MSYLKPGIDNANASTSTLGYTPYNDADTPGPYPVAGNPSLAAFSSTSRPMPVRTPSPTPSDIEELKKGAVDWKYVLNWRNWAQRKYLWYYIGGAIFAVIAALLSIFHKQLINWLTPGATYLRDLHGGWSIPIGIMFVLSFPPLFGNEIVHVLCGIVWGLWVGFGIVCAGTFLGEIGNFYAFRYCCQSRGDKLERTSLPYACLARCVREGGFLVAVIARLSAIPGHFTTAVFSTCGMSIWTFCLGAFLSLPKQFATVYVGVVLDQAAGTETTQQRVVSAAVLTISIGVTIFAAWWILHRMAAAKPAVLAERRKKKAMDEYSLKMYSMSGTSDLESSLYPAGNDSQNPFQTPNASVATLTPYAPGKANFDQPFNYNGSSPNLPLSVKPQRWDANGRAIVENQDLYDNSYPPPQSQYRPNLQPQGQGSPLRQPAPLPPGASQRVPPPNIMVTRASGLSTASVENRQSSYDDVPLATPTRPAPGPSQPAIQQQQQRQSPRSYPQNPPVRRGTDESSNESSGPAWVAGTTREDEAEVKSPLTAAIRQTAPPSSTRSPPGLQRETSLYNPYDTPPPAGSHALEPTDASMASFHTAQGSNNGFEMVDYPAGPGSSTPSDRYTQQSPSPPQGGRR